jgi:hypothetical protein
MTIKQVLFLVVEHLSDLEASVDVLEAALLQTGQVTSDGIGRSFAAHKQVAEQDLARLRGALALLPD